MYKSIRCLLIVIMLSMIVFPCCKKKPKEPPPPAVEIIEEPLDTSPEQITEPTPTEPMIETPTPVRTRPKATTKTVPPTPPIDTKEEPTLPPAIAEPTIYTPSSTAQNPLQDVLEQTFGAINTNSRIAILQIQSPDSDMNEFLRSEVNQILTNRGYNVIDESLSADAVITGRVADEEGNKLLILDIIDTQSGIITSTATVPYTDIAKLYESKQTPPEPPVKSTPSEPFVYYKIFAGSGLYMMRGLKSKTDSVYGFNLGASLDFRMGKTPLLLETGARYIIKGSKYQGYSWGMEVSCEESYHYVDIFAKAKWNGRIASALAIQPYIGYATSILSSANSKLEMGSYQTDNNIKDECNNLMHIGLVGIDFLIKDKFVIGAEYDRGLSNIWKTGYPEVTSDTVMMNVGYRF